MQCFCIQYNCRKNWIISLFLATWKKRFFTTLEVRSTKITTKSEKFLLFSPTYFKCNNKKEKDVSGNKKRIPQRLLLGDSEKKLKNGLLVYQFKVSSSANERRLLPLRYLGFWNCCRSNYQWTKTRKFELSFSTEFILLDTITKKDDAWLLGRNSSEDFKSLSSTIKKYKNFSVLTIGHRTYPETFEN